MSNSSAAQVAATAHIVQQAGSATSPNMHMLRDSRAMCVYTDLAMVSSAAARLTQVSMQDGSSAMNPSPYQLGKHTCRPAAMHSLHPVHSCANGNCAHFIQRPRLDGALESLELLTSLHVEFVTYMPFKHYKQGETPYSFSYVHWSVPREGQGCLGAPATIKRSPVPATS